MLPLLAAAWAVQTLGANSSRHVLRDVDRVNDDSVRVDTIPDPRIDDDNPTGGANGLAYGVVGYTYGPGIDHPIAVLRRGSTNTSVPNPVVVFPHAGWRGMLSLTTNADGERNDCPMGGNICLPIDLPGANATVDRGKKAEIEPLSWFGSLLSSNAEQSGLQYKRNRYYDPKRGQFTQADPIGLAGGANLYGFAAGDAVNFDDPFGLCPPRDSNPADCPGRMGAAVLLGQSAHATNSAVARFLPENLFAALSGIAAGRLVASIWGAVAARSTIVAAEEVLMPRGVLLGRAGSSADIREVDGGIKNAEELFGRLAKRGTRLSSSTYPGTLVRLPDGGTVGMRTTMSRSPGTIATLDVDIRGIPISKIKFNPK